MIISLHHGTSLSPTLFGNKGSNLAHMTSIGIPVPPGFILSLDVQEAYRRNPQSIELALQIALKQLEDTTQLCLGNPERPLFVSVRSGAPYSMPGMMDTFLNIGLHKKTVKSLGERLGDPTQAQLLYRSFFTTYERNFRKYESQKSFKKPEEMSCYDHLLEAIKAVWASWYSPRANAYKHEKSLPSSTGTAVIIQAMVFGNGKSPSGTGVVFTRHPTTGDREILGEYLPNAQGESLVSGQDTPLSLSFLKETYPSLYEELVFLSRKLEADYGDMQDIEFTIENGKLWILQTRTGGRTPSAAFRIGCDLIQEGVVSEQEVLLSLDANSLNSLLHSYLPSGHGLHERGRGLGASPGAASGCLIFDPERVEKNHILFLSEVTPEAMSGMMRAKGVIALKGGMTSHAAIIMRSLNKPFITALQEALWNGKELVIQGQILCEGEEITIDGSTGTLLQGEALIEKGSLSAQASSLLEKADAFRTTTLLANVDCLAELETALDRGAEGVGLLRSEHMIFWSKGYEEMIYSLVFSSSQEERSLALDKIRPFYEKDFYLFLKLLQGRLFTMRFLDPPFHEFLPPLTCIQSQKDLASRRSLSYEEVASRLQSLHEVNPMMGHRGCRLGISFPELYALQASTLFHAAHQCQKEGIPVSLALLIPFVSHREEIVFLKNLIQSQALPDVSYDIGIMVETPRSALMMDTFAPLVDFISFGTNDLTQMTWGLSRDDSASFFPVYTERGIKDPFITFDEEGVGQLLKLACIQGKKANPRLKISVCGNHAGSPEAIKFFHGIGIDAFSCAPGALLGARLASAQAFLQEQLSS